MDREKIFSETFPRGEEAEEEKDNFARSNLSPITVWLEVVLSFSRNVSQGYEIEHRRMPVEAKTA